MSVDEIREAVERTVPSYRGRTGDWDGVLVRARAREAPRRDWRRAAVLALAGVLALVLLWPGDDGDRVLERARAAVRGGPVVHLVLRSGSQEFYDLRRGELRQVPTERELWFDENRGLRQVERIQGRVLDDVLYETAGPEVAMQFLGLADVYREALAAGNADVGDRDEIDGRDVYWIEFRVRYPAVGIPTYDAEHRVAVDGETYEPVIWEADGAEYRILKWETLPSGQGDFTAGRTEDGAAGERWYGVARVGMRTPSEAREALPGAAWLGESFQDLTLHSIRELRYETGTTGPPFQSLPGLELCYGTGEPCALTISQTTEPHPMAGRGHGWRVTPPPGTLAFAESAGLGYVVRDGVYVTLQARSRDELIAAAKALRPISAGSGGGG
jgi:hypothetical protein